ncbi:helix-turn-helix transcriptional regulator [Streptomyces rubiginosohelvolus]|uniref:helix-turn-helix transcriptional regulator n=1 Tax=Streptomyces rubiginosohelvolus TaxID=67362 RepID=UPI00365262B6
MKMLRARAAQQEARDPEREMSYDIAQQVFEGRTALGLTQGELAARSGTKQPAISGLESAKKLPTLGLLIRVAAALDRRLVIRFEKIKESE